MPQTLSPTLRTPSRPARDYQTTSPNYFGLTIDSDEPPIPSSVDQSGYLSKTPWSQVDSGVRSAAASSPQSMPVDSSPEYASFRRQSEHVQSSKNKTKSEQQVSSPAERPSLGRRTSSKADQHSSPPARSQKSTLQKADTIGHAESSQQLKSSRPSTADAANILDRPRRDSPAGMDQHAPSRAPEALARVSESDHPRRSLPHTKDQKRSNDLGHHRAETLPASLSTEGPTLTTPQHVVNVLESSGEVLILDLRVSTQYARSRIQGALNLCIPTTLLKRSSFNVRRLVETFKDDGQRAKFENWKHCKCIIVYDNSSSQLKEAQACVNILNKFQDDGWDGPTCVVRGGFEDFAKKFPKYVEKGFVPSGSKDAKTPNITINQPATPSVAPVIGGCPMPATDNAANPFFGNIRQNMDLVAGVGQMPLKRPASMTDSREERMPKWLKLAAEEVDKGKGVSEKFLQIEKREQKRMQEALSGKVVYDSLNPDSEDHVKIAGIEKGAKNRYNNIWPYEHSRVKLEGIPSDGCDYVNASHIKTSMSDKRYIATQGPIPATFVDFWNMVWQHDVRVLVMLTAESEGGQVKAHNYWQDKKYGPLRLTRHSEHRASLEPSRIHKHRERPPIDRKRSSQHPSSGSSSSGTRSDDKSQQSPPSDEPHIIVRKFTLSHENLPFERMREITQLQYSSWPDFGVPAHPAHILGLVEQCESVVRSSKKTIPSDSASERPVLVHCSAGCGRTGTFCTVDNVIDVLKKQQQHRAQKQRKREASPMDVDEGQPSVNPFFGQGVGQRGTTPGGGGDSSDWLESDDVDLVEKTVEEFRLQRLSMVQSLRQFVLVYEAILEWFAGQ